MKTYDLQKVRNAIDRLAGLGAIPSVFQDLGTLLEYAAAKFCEEVVASNDEAIAHLKQQIERNQSRLN